MGPKKDYLGGFSVMKRPQTGHENHAAQTAGRSRLMVGPQSSRPRSAQGPKPQVGFVQDFGVPFRGTVREGAGPRRLDSPDVDRAARRPPL
jgi:hypothetical protein